MLYYVPWSNADTLSGINAGNREVDDSIFLQLDLELGPDWKFLVEGEENLEGDLGPSGEDYRIRQDGQDIDGQWLGGTTAESILKRSWRGKLILRKFFFFSPN